MSITVNNPGYRKGLNRVAYAFAVCVAVSNRGIIFLMLIIVSTDVICGVSAVTIIGISAGVPGIAMRIFVKGNCKCICAIISVGSSHSGICRKELVANLTLLVSLITRCNTSCSLRGSDFAEGVALCRHRFGICCSATCYRTSICLDTIIQAIGCCCNRSAIPGMYYCSAICVTSVNTLEGVGGILAITVALNSTSVGMLLLGNDEHSISSLALCRIDCCICRKVQMASSTLLVGFVTRCNASCSLRGIGFAEGVTLCRHRFGICCSATCYRTSICLDTIIQAIGCCCNRSAIPGMYYCSAICVTSVNTLEGVGGILAITVALNSTSVGMLLLGNDEHSISSLALCRIDCCICRKVQMASSTLLVGFVTRCNASCILRGSSFAEGVLNSFGVLCRIGHSTGYGSDFLVPATEDVGSTTDLSFIGAALEAGCCTILISLGSLYTVHNPGDGVLIDRPSTGDSQVLCRHCGCGRVPTLKGISDLIRARISDSRTIIDLCAGNLVAILILESQGIAIHRPLSVVSGVTCGLVYRVGINLCASSL